MIAGLPTLIIFVLSSTLAASFPSGKKHGQAKVTLANGDKYVGTFKEDYPNGKGTYIAANSISEMGIWAYEKASKRGSVTFKNGITKRFTLTDGNNASLISWFSLSHGAPPDTRHIGW